MTPMFEELDWQPTAIGPVSLRRRRELRLGVDVYEVKLGEAFLMSSLFTTSEVALARLALGLLPQRPLDVVVGGLGLGHTAATVLQDDRVASCTVVEFLRPVIDWHATGLVPLGPTLTRDPRCRLLEGDFFSLAMSREGFDPQTPQRRVDAVLVDIDHSPADLLHPRSSRFYEVEGLTAMRRHLKPGGVFGLWSDALPERAMAERLALVFDEVRAEPVSFHNPLRDEPFTQTVYLGQHRPRPVED